MHIHSILALAALPAVLGALANNATIPGLFEEFPDCGILCFDDACSDTECTPTDLDCVCQNPASLTVKMGICVGKQCDGDEKAIEDHFDSGLLLADICERFEKKTAATTELAAASSSVSSRISALKAAETASHTSSESSKSTNAAPAMTEMPHVVMMGAAALAAMAL